MHCPWAKKSTSFYWDVNRDVWHLIGICFKPNCSHRGLPSSWLCAAVFYPEQGEELVFRYCSCVYFPAPSPLNFCLTSLLLCSACALWHLGLTRASLKEQSFWIPCSEWGYPCPACVLQGGGMSSLLPHAGVGIQLRNVFKQWYISISKGSVLPKI